MGKRKCLFPACKSNIDNETPKYSLYSFPNPDKFFPTYVKWLDFCQIPLRLAESTINSNTRICSLHFLPLCFNPSNSLKQGSIPSLFPPTTPSGMSLSSTKFFSEAEVETNLVKPIVHPRQEAFTFSGILIFCQSFVASNPVFLFKEVSNGILLLIPEQQAPFRNIFSLFIKSDKSVSFFSFGEELDKKEFQTFFDKKYFITSIEVLSSLLEFISLGYQNFHPEENEVKSPFDQLREISGDLPIISFFEDQLTLATQEPTARRFNLFPETMVFAFSLISASRAAYNLVSEVLILPSERAIRRYSSDTGKTFETNEANLAYFKKQCQALPSHERDITLKYDEVQIKSKFGFRSGKVFGFAENRADEAASHLQCFMVRSMKSKYREIVRFLPVHKQTSTYLKKHLLEVVDLLETSGFRIMAITSDNASINSNVTKSLTEGFSKTFFFSSLIPGHKIFIFKDAPHFIKSIRNNWLNLKNTEKTFVFPAFRNESFGRTASFKKIRDLYVLESEKCLKLGFKLNYSCIFPSSIERQKVHLALRVFDETTAAAIKSIYPEETGLYNFLNLINRVWKCFNVNNTTKGIHLSDEYSLPYTSTSDKRIGFLREFAAWVDRWNKEGTYYGKLSKQTFFSVSFSCRSLADCLEYMLGPLNYTYILSYVFSSDCIESMFSALRQSNGGSFHMTHDQVVSALKKFRVKSTILLHGKPILLDDSLKNDGNSIIQYDSLSIEFSEFEEFEENDKDSAIYIGGYISKKIVNKYSCPDCILSFNYKKQKDSDLVESVYFESINRNGLSIPSIELVNIILKCSKFFSLYIKEKVSSCSLKLICLVDLFHQLLVDLGDIDNLEQCGTHLDVVDKILEESLTVLAKLLLKNYTNSLSDLVKASKPEMGKKAKYDSPYQLEKFYQ